MEIIKKLLLTISVFALAVSCQKSEPYVPDNPDEKVPITFGTAFTSSVTTKAAGTLEDSWNGRQDIYIFGIKRLPEKSLSERIFINNVKAEASPASGTSGIIRVFKPGINPPEYFFYESDNNYDFYGYYVDDGFHVNGNETGPSPVKNDAEGTIRVPVRITGGQDILYAEADPQRDRREALLEAEKAGINLVIDENRVYSAYSARRYVNPKLIFNHILSRFDFEIKAGNESFSAEYVNVKSISLTTVPDADGMVSSDRGNIVVLDLNSSGNNGKLIPEKRSGNGAKFTLMQKNADTGLLEPLGSDIRVDMSKDGNGNLLYRTKPVGDGLMLFAGETAFDLDVVLEDSRYTSNPMFNTVRIYAKDVMQTVNNQEQNAGKTAFAAGEYYKITISIYGLQEIKVVASLNAWKDGGHIEIDTD